MTVGREWPRRPAPAAGGGDTAGLLRRGLLGLAGLGIAGTAVELVFLRHWGALDRSIVWAGMLALAAAFAALARAQSAGAVTAVRWLAAVAAVVALAGVGFHVIENLDAGPLNADFAATWTARSFPEQLFLATTGSVGPAPVLAPGSILEIALALALATVRHPLLEPRGA